MQQEQESADLKRTELSERDHKINTFKMTKNIKGLINMKKDNTFFKSPSRFLNELQSTFYK